MTGVFVRFLSDFSAPAVVAGRLLCSLIVIGTVVLWSKRYRRALLMDFGNLTTWTLGGLLFLYYYAAVAAFDLAPVSDVALLISVSPLFVLLYRLFNRSGARRFHPVEWTGADRNHRRLSHHVWGRRTWRVVVPPNSGGSFGLGRRLGDRHLCGFFSAPLCIVSCAPSNKCCVHDVIFWWCAGARSGGYLRRSAICAARRCRNSPFSGTRYPFYRRSLTRLRHGITAPTTAGHDNYSIINTRFRDRVCLDLPE